MPNMIPCINQATVLPLDTLDFLVQARDAGFRLVELDITKLEEAVQRHGLPKVKDTVTAADVKIVSLNAIENYPILSSNEIRSSLERCEGIFKLSRELECEVAVVNPNEYHAPMRRRTELAFDSFIRKTTKIARQYSVRMAYEFVAYENRIYNTLAASLEGLSRWDSDVTIGLVLDIFHLFRSGEAVSQIPERMMNRVWIFHVNDAPPMPMSELNDSHRVLPGDGVINIQKSLEELGRAGFSGPVSLELFNRSYWEKPAAEVLRESWDRLQELLRSAVR